MSKKFKVAVELPLLKITEGSPGAGKVLTSDADGDATWQTPVTPPLRVSSTASGSSVTPDLDNYDLYLFTALAANLTINAPTGSSIADGTKLLIRIKDNGTIRTLTWNAIYRVIGVSLPTVTIVSKTSYIGLVYNSTDTKWDVIAVQTEV